MDLDRLLDSYDEGRLDRRQFGLAIAALLGAKGATAQAASTQPSSPTFQATGLDHIALSVTDPKRSSEFYQRHLGLTVTSQSSSSVFMDCGPHFLALFRGGTPGLAHYSYAIPNYTQESAAERLRAAGLQPKLRGQRTYFDDPDGIEVQVSRGTR